MKRRVITSLDIVNSQFRGMWFMGIPHPTEKTNIIKFFDPNKKQYVFQEYRNEL